MYKSCFCWMGELRWIAVSKNKLYCFHDYCIFLRSRFFWSCQHCPLSSVGEIESALHDETKQRLRRRQRLLPFLRLRQNQNSRDETRRNVVEWNLTSGKQFMTYSNQKAQNQFSHFAVERFPKMCRPKNGSLYDSGRVTIILNWPILWEIEVYRFLGTVSKKSFTQV